jgi:exodeoxyribonuclease-3
MKIATWNVNSLNVRLPHLLDWLKTASPDLLGIQETKTTDDKFPRDAIIAAGYQPICNGQKTYNGVAILSRLSTAPQDMVTQLPDMLDDPQRRLLAATYGDVRMINVYIPNGAEVDSEKYHYKLRWLRALVAYLKTELRNHPKLAIVGDFNIAPEDRDVHDPKSWEGSVLVSPAERECFQQLVSLGLVDSFRLFEQAPELFSWWDYRAAAYPRNHGLRIDHILVSPKLATACQSCHIDPTPRQWERPSDHAPVIAEFT